MGIANTSSMPYIRDDYNAVHEVQIWAGGQNIMDNLRLEATINNNTFNNTPVNNVNALSETAVGNIFVKPGAGSIYSDNRWRNARNVVSGKFGLDWWQTPPYNSAGGTWAGSDDGVASGIIDPQYLVIELEREYSYFEIEAVVVYYVTQSENNEMIYSNHQFAEYMFSYKNPLDSDFMISRDTLVRWPSNNDVINQYRDDNIRIMKAKFPSYDNVNSFASFRSGNLIVQDANISQTNKVQVSE